MKQIIHINRNGCALHGALQVLRTIQGFVPIVHSSAGCSIPCGNLSYVSTGSFGSFASNLSETASTNVIEKQIVFGGTSRLREQIKNTVKVLQGEVYVTVTGCATEVVGDDVPAMVKEAQEQGFPVIHVSTPGFKGNVFKGYELVVKGLIEQLPQQADGPIHVQQGLVNILGVIPERDIFWDGNLQYLKELLTKIGIDVNSLVGPGEGLKSWLRISKAQLNLVVSPWGLEIAKCLENKYGTPYFYLGWYPVGPEDTGSLLSSLADRLSISMDIALKLISHYEWVQKYHLQKIREVYFRNNLQREVVLVGDTATVTGITRFLKSTFGQFVKTVIITDDPPEELREVILTSIRHHQFSDVIFTHDGEEINQVLRNEKTEIILGSSLEQGVARELRVPLLTISAPVFDKVILNRAYLGYQGAIHLVEDFVSKLLETSNSHSYHSDVRTNVPKTTDHSSSHHFIKPSDFTLKQQ